MTNEEAPDVAAILGDAMFNGTLKTVVVVGIVDSGDMILWHSNECVFKLVGMLEAAKLQILGVKAEEEDDDE